MDFPCIIDRLIKEINRPKLNFTKRRYFIFSVEITRKNYHKIKEEEIMLKKKMISLAMIILLLSTFSLFEGSTLAAGSSNENTTAAACENVTLVYYSKNSWTKEVIFKVTGTPGNMVSLHINKYLGGWVKSSYSYLPSNGIDYITVQVDNGSYEANVNQESPCIDQAGPIFFTMN